MKNKRKIQGLLVLLVFAFVLLIPRTYAFYFSKYESLLNMMFTINKNNVPKTAYVRATVLTYWIDSNSCTNANDLTTCDIYGRSAWNLKSSAINSNWTLSDDGYYYYSGNVDGTTVNESNITPLINPNLSLTDLTDDYLLGTNVIPQYEILYDVIQQTN